MTIAKAVIRSVLALAFIGMGIAHFRAGPAKTMARMIPPALRGRDPRTPARLVALTGACEIAGGVGLVVPRTRPAAAVALMVFLVAVFPANAYASEHPERFGPVATPFWPRLGGQILLIGLLGATLVA
ncbi:DoxX family membrane protein [Amnibacterium flavum]|uniref:DoxX family protein n=1 Tax=Amnibacterium flavum TaxID=2173173 RepID=A0A2V1HW09_9MICO|nr:DoxX family membrane protein [Amnibacterium flavum]PVZ95992.1 hypothetical protein DDQ50_05960 [Amnibacterium flavum]